jgi:hypothetical protein
MSIFKDTFIPEVQNQLRARQDAIKKRDVTSIKYLNSRNAWIRMSSSVDVNKDKGKSASENILQGGTLYNNNLRAGVGENKAYNYKTPSGQTHQKGLRPMPGINSIDIKSKSAYGSLREVVVKFQCWDIKQLEDLELLYMRPGYTVLIEWGWLPYLKDENTLEYNVVPKDIITEIPSKEDIWKDLFNRSKNTGGNYDAMFGYVKNYSWSAREDGGYDCTTTIISIGEILESLKINYTPLTSKLTKGTNGLLNIISLDKDLEDKYKKNILAGLFAELYASSLKKIPNPKEDGEKLPLPDSNNNQTYNFYLRKLKKTNSTGDPNKLVNSKAEEIDVYITLDSLVEILNKYVILSDTKSKQPMVKLSTYEREYDKKDPNIKEPLLCLGHPLQISVDPTICLIGNDFWSELKSQKTKTQTGGSTTVTSPGVGVVTPSFNVVTTTFDNENTKYLQNLIPYFTDKTKELGIIGNIYLNLQFLYSISLDNNLESQDKKEKQEISIYDFIKNIISQVSNCIGNVNNFDIHVDPIDNNIARIIDINYVNNKDKKDILGDKNTFILEMHNLSSTVRSYKLESQIFQEQSSIIAIGAQVQGGALGTDSNTMAGFNKGITDRIIPIKTDPNSLQLEKEEEIRNIELKKVSESLKEIFNFFGDKTKVYFWQTPSSSYDTNNSSKYANALKDLISAFKSLTNDKNKYNAIIPTKLSITMDGIGGLVIGHIFKIPDNLLPKGYKGSGLGSKLGYIITGVGHSISNNDWITNIDAQTIILDDPRPGIDGEIISYQDLIKLIEQGPAFEQLPSAMEKILESNSINTRLTSETKFTSSNNEAKNEASKYLERPISDIEWNQLVSATFAEASNDQTERAYVMAAILNRARRDRQTITKTLYAKNQFQAVTGTPYKPGPSIQYVTGPNALVSNNIYEATLKTLKNVPKNIVNFTAANLKAYGPPNYIGTRPEYINELKAKGGFVIGQTIFSK